MRKTYPNEQIKGSVLDSLGEYSISLPTGKRIGKVWEKDRNWGTGKDPDWLICEYIPDRQGDPKFVGIDYRQAVIIEG